ncbi:N-acetylmuramoyl-L-alanine amidase (plasmid) [Rhizobium leguminosarum]|uniref:N-acetylmuramoyl-L-alanine amidase n=1 Tax=Rhizobium leguminosarum TaxID=384 RepID=UPI001442773A|nr:N-acetylmuramoyl-L-alanine amidase [Rhizobium leguminosarum]MBY5835623.1 hypothetical protein [Rhizobium leguminosarum]NKM78260.1 hypothetical protein [Rhizobium leguminosarum bv. viciae]QSZ11993.1 N-acetylmuramoyl-L-alanine amidase [Rhizobium leguminosarum]
MSAWDDLIAKYQSFNDVPAATKVGSLAQWILESGRGSSQLARQHLNFGGLKFRERMVGFAQPVDYRGSDGEMTTYCKFSSIDEFIKGYWHFIDSGPYTEWRNNCGSPEEYVAYLKSVGYAADPNYVTKVKALFGESSELLGVDDGAVPGAGQTGTEPGRPAWQELTARYLNVRTTPVLGIVLHDTAGSGTHNDTIYLSNPQDGRKVSVDFTVERDGSIWKLNPDLRTHYCNHAGRATQWRGFKNAQVNAVTVGIEIVQKSDLSLNPVYTDNQVTSVAQLCAWLSNEFGLAASDITTHRQIITDGSRSDPRRFPFDTPNGFWAKYWECFGRHEQFVASLGEGDGPALVEVLTNAA